MQNWRLKTLHETTMRHRGHLAEQTVCNCVATDSTNQRPSALVSLLEPNASKQRIGIGGRLWGATGAQLLGMQATNYENVNVGHMQMQIK